MNKTLFYLILLLLGAVCAKAASTRIEAHIFVTNAPSGWPTQSLTWNGTSTRTWTNSVVAPATQVMATNNIQNSRTNLKVQLDTYKFSLLHQVNYGTATNEVVVLSGTNQPIAITIAGLWAYVTYVTNVADGQDFVMMPFKPSQETNGFGVRIMSQLATNFAKATSSVPAWSLAFTNFPNLSQQAQSMTNKSAFGGTNAPERLVVTNGALSLVSLSNVIATNLTGSITNPFVRGGTNELGVFTNVLRANINLGVVTNLYALTAVVSNGTLIGTIDLNGVFTKLTNGTLYHASVTNAPWLNATNANLGTARIDTLTVWTGATITNLSAPGTGAGSQRIGSGSTVSAANSIVFGVGTTLDGADTAVIGNNQSIEAANAFSGGHDVVMTSGSQYGVNVGYGNVIDGIGTVTIGSSIQNNYAYSVGVGYGTITTATNQIRLGTAAEHVSIPGRLEATHGNITTIVGSNNFAGSFSLQGGTVSTLVNGNNAGIILSTNPVVELSGATTIAQIAGFAASRDGDTRLLRITGAITNIVVNEANSIYSTDPTAANRIVTGTGGDFYMTNNPAWMKLRYRATSSRWEVLDKSN